MRKTNSNREKRKGVNRQERAKRRQKKTDTTTLECQQFVVNVKTEQNSVVLFFSFVLLSFRKTFRFKTHSHIPTYTTALMHAHTNSEREPPKQSSAENSLFIQKKKTKKKCFKKRQEEPNKNKNQNTERVK